MSPLVAGKKKVDTKMTTRPATIARVGVIVFHCEGPDKNWTRGLKVASATAMVLVNCRNLEVLE